MSKPIAGRTFADCAKPQISKLVPYSPGKPIDEVKRERGLTDVIKLASNENPFGPAPCVVEAVRAAATDLQLYPDAGCVELKAALARLHGVAPDHITLGNGSDELLQLIGTAVLDEGDELIIGDPTFARYEPQATMNRAVAVKVPLKNYTHDVEAMAAAVTPRTKAMIIANPHNPMGTYVGDTAIEWLIDNTPENVMIVLDEAYFDFVDDADFGRSQAMALAHPNVVLLRTFSKIHAIAALRVGYAIASVEAIEWIDAVREPFNVNSLGQVAALAALTDQKHVVDAIAANKQGRDRYMQMCAELGIEAIPSQANFVMMNLGRPDLPVFDKLLDKGVIVRAGTAIHVPNCLRVTVGTPAEVDRFIEAFTEVWKG